MSNFHRFLNPAETTFTYCNEQSPLSVVIAIFYQGIMDKARIRLALDQLQSRYTLLNCRIQKNKGSYFFEKILPHFPLPLIVHSGNDHQWKDQTEKLLNERFDTKKPLLHCHFLPSGSSASEGKILLHIHHAIIDGHSARLLLSEFLQLLGGQSLQESLLPTIIPYAYPKAFQKWSGLLRQLRFLYSQIIKEGAFFRKGLKHPIPESDRNAILHLELDKKLSTRLLRRAGQEGVNLNSLISAALLHAFYKQEEEKNTRLLRTVAFADLRNKMTPAVPSGELGCHIAMARFSVPLSRQSTLLSTARHLWNQMYMAGKKGDLFCFSQLGAPIMKISFRFKKFRLANTALSYIGPLELQKQYGPISLLDIQTYIANNKLGPSLTAFGKYLFGKISLDINYLSSEYSESDALELLAGIKASLEDIAYI